ncbi:MAG: DNA repair protein RecO, partial [Treponema sp.]|nr:DNA repair protein RecO [Treponema sp.]
SAAATLIAGTVLAGHGGGGAWADALALTGTALDALENADESCCDRITLHFLWNWAGILGHQPDPRRCASCACEARDDGVLWFIQGEGLLCNGCMLRERPGSGVSSVSAAALGPGARRWLLAVGSRSPGELARYSLDAASLGELKVLMNRLVTYG